jgi:hypothetical protein
MDYNHNCKYHNFVKSIQPQWGQVRGEETKDLGGRGRSEEKTEEVLSCQFKVKRLTRDLSVDGYLLTC